MDLSKLSTEDLLALKAGDLSKVSTEGLMHLKGQSAPQGTGNAALDATNAVSTGFNRGLVRLAGVPVDTVANVIDLGKAALGSGYQAITGKPAPDSLQLTDRRNVVGSGDWLVDKIGGTAPGNVAINPINPEYEGGYLQTAGAGLNAVINPNSRAQAVNQAVLGVTSALSGKAVGEATGNPALAVTASLAPSGIQQAVTAGTKGFVRGANPMNAQQMEAKRREMEARVLALQEAGVENPTLGLASGNRMIGGVENLLQSTPGAVGIMGRARDQAVAGMQAKTEGAADRASTNRGALASGQSIQSGINKFKEDFKTTQERLYGRLDESIDPQDPATITNTRQRLGELNADIKGAPALSRFFKNEKMQALEAALNSDTSGSPESVHVYRQPPRAGGGIMNAPIPQDPLQVVIPEGAPRNTLPFEAVKKTRTLVGNELADHSLLSDVPRSKWNALYGALTEDIGQTARAAGPEATSAFNRANDYTRSGINRLEKLSPFMPGGGMHGGDVAPEQAFTTLAGTAKENVSILQAVKKSLPQDARGQFAGTIIDRLGKATNSNQNAAGTAWSPETFLTNWNKLSPRARQEIFSGFDGAANVKASVEAVAEAASMMRDSSRMWANPSGSGANVMARATLGALGVGGGASLAGLLNPMIPLGAGVGMLGANRLAAALTSGNVRNALMRPDYLSPQHAATQAIPLFSTGEF